jgi:GNAT superfamily N-acetyltransferase
VSREHDVTAAHLALAVVDPASPEARRCLAAYVVELNSRFRAGFDPERSIPASDDELRPPAGLFLIASLQGEPIGCGALKLHGAGPAELKRMWVAASARGLGVGRRILGRLEELAAEAGAKAVRLETNASLVEAIALYRSAGYAEVEAFNDETYADHWFEKSLEPQPDNGV